MSFLDTVKSRVRSWLLTPEEQEQNKLVKETLKRADYTEGFQKAPLKIVDGQNDNVIINELEQVITDTIDMMLGSGIGIDTEDEKQKEFITETMRYNKGDIFWQNSCWDAAIAGTGYIIQDPQYYEDKYPRFVLMNPTMVTVITDPEDIDDVWMYRISYVYTNAEGKEVERKREVRKKYNDVLDEDGNPTGERVFAEAWEDVVMWRDGDTWKVESEIDWPFKFPPVIHWQNLPVPHQVYGRSDISLNAMHIQDAINFTASNFNKILKIHAHPKTIVTGCSEEDIGVITTGPDQMFVLPEGDAKNLEMQSDLQASYNYWQELRNALFETTRTTNTSMIADKVGQLTNFGLRVLFRKSLAKNETKRSIFGEMIEELFRRALIVHGYDPTPIIVSFPSALPMNAKEDAEILEKDKDAGILSKETHSELRGYEYEKEKKRLDDEKEEEGSLTEKFIQRFLAQQ